MKALMYHYVRPAPADLPYFRYLHIDSFRRQLDWIEATHGFVSRDRFLDALHTGTPANGVVLTFDDAFSDPFLHVFHELSSRGLWGIRSEEHTSELQSLMRISYAVFCLKTIISTSPS